MVKRFEPDARQRALIEEAKALARTAAAEGHHAPLELVNRMTEEARFLSAPDSHDIRFSLAALVKTRLDRNELHEWIGVAGCISAAQFEFPRPLLLVEFIRNAPSLQDGVLQAVEDIRQRIPGAVFIDMNDSNSFIDGLVEASTERPLSDEEIHRLICSATPEWHVAHAPLVDEFKELDELAAKALLRGTALDNMPATAGKPLSENPQAPPPTAPLLKGLRAVWTEATVVEVLPSCAEVRLTTSDGRTLVFNRRTPVAKGFSTYEEGQLYRCLVVSRFSVVLSAELLTAQD